MPPVRLRHGDSFIWDWRWEEIWFYGRVCICLSTVLEFLYAVLRRQVDREGDVRMHLAVATSEASHGWIIIPFPEFAATTAPKPWMRKFLSEIKAVKWLWLVASNVFGAACAGLPCTVYLSPFQKTFIPKEMVSGGSMTRVCKWKSFLWMHSNLFNPPQSSSSTRRTLISFLAVGANTAAWMSKVHQSNNIET